VITLDILLSSAYSAICDGFVIWLGMSLINIVKTKGSKMEPWGTPGVTNNQSDFCPPSTMHMLISEPGHYWTAWNPKSTNFFNDEVCDTLSNAFEKSRYIHTYIHRLYLKHGQVKISLSKASKMLSVVKLDRMSRRAFKLLKAMLQFINLRLYEILNVV
jgi:hypothetical protein